MPTLSYEKLFFEIRESSFIKEYSTDDGGRLKIYYASQKDKNMGKPTLVRALKKDGEGKEILYGINGHPVLEVGLKHGKPYGRAKMFDENGIRIFPNTYWWYGFEIKNAYDYFSKLEDEEKKLIAEEEKVLKKNQDLKKIPLIQNRYEIRKNKIYAPKEIWGILRLQADISMPVTDERKVFFKKYFPKER